MSRVLLFVFTLFSLLAISPTIRADDELDRYRKTAQVAAQKLASQVTDTIADSRKLERTDPSEARQRLYDMQRRVKDSSAIGAVERDRLNRQLQLRINDLDEIIRARRIAQNLKPLEQPKPRTGSTTPPSGGSGASGFAKDFIGNAKKPLEVAQDMIKRRENGFRDTLNAYEKTPVYPTEDRPIVFPPGWKFRKPAGPQLTAKEAALLRALNSVMTVNYDGTKFKTVLDDIQEKSGITLILNENALKDVMIDYEEMVNFKLPVKVTVRTALKKVLGDKGLTYIIKEGTVQVMTPKQASEMMVIRSYPVQDLVQPDTMTQMFGPFVAQQQMLINAQQLINLITQNVEPNSWAPNGPATITFHIPTQSLIVRASAEMHYQMAGSGGLFGR